MSSSDSLVKGVFAKELRELAQRLAGNGPGIRLEAVDLPGAAVVAVMMEIMGKTTTSGLRTKDGE
jgi:hypothetical protein